MAFPKKESSLVLYRWQVEHHKIKGGGVYSFSYLVLGPTISFIAVASILVDYILTAAISTVSAVQNGASFVDLSPFMIYVLMFAVVWGVVGLNIIGIKEKCAFYLPRLYHSCSCPSHAACLRYY